MPPARGADAVERGFRHPAGMDARRAFLRSVDVQTAGIQLDLLPLQIDQLRGAQAVAIGDEHHRRIAMTMPAVLASCIDQLLDLALGQIAPACFD